MTLRLAAVQHFCARFADAVLTSWSPLTYERGDYMDGTEKLDPEYWEPPDWFHSTPKSELMLDAERVVVAATEMAAHVQHFLDSGAAPPAASVTPAPVDGTPPASPGAGLSSQQLDWIEPAFYDVLTCHRPQEYPPEIIVCANVLPGEHCGRVCLDMADWREHVWAEFRARIKA